MVLAIDDEHLHGLARVMDGRDVDAVVIAFERIDDKIAPVLQLGCAARCDTAVGA